MKHPRVTVVALVAIVMAAAAAASVVAAASDDSRTGPPAATGATAAAGTTATTAATAAAETTGTADGAATGVAGTLRLVDPGGPMIAAGGSPEPRPTILLELLSPVTNAAIAGAWMGAGSGFRVPVTPGSYRVRAAPAAGSPSATVAHLVDATDDGSAGLVHGPVPGL